MALFSRRALWVVVWIAGLAALGFAIGFVLFARELVLMPTRDVHTAPSQGRVSGIVVLTGRAPLRIRHGLQLLVQGEGERLFITGLAPGTLKSQLPLPRSVAAAALEHKLSCCVDLGYAARNTAENAAQIAYWVRQHAWARLIIVTSRHHMPRALSELSRRLPHTPLLARSVVPPSVHLQQWWRHPGTFRLLVQEYARYLVSLAWFYVEPLVG